MTSDTVVTLERDPSLVLQHGPGTRLAYLAFNLRDPYPQDVRVRQAIAYALDRRPMLEYMWRDQVQPAYSILPPLSWAYDDDVARYDYDPDKARQMLDAAGYPAAQRRALSSDDEDRDRGEHAAAGSGRCSSNCGMWALRSTFAPSSSPHFLPTSPAALSSSILCAGSAATKIPIFLTYSFHSRRFPPRGGNRGFYSNPRIDGLIDQARRETDQNARKTAVLLKFRKCWRKMSRISICGTSITCSCTRGACGT